MCDSQTKTEYRPIAEIVQEATNGGQLIVEFLTDVILGKIEGANIWHRMEATRQLERLGLQLPDAVKQAVSTQANGTKPSRAPAKPRQEDELADIIKQETGGGRDIVRFLIDAMQGKLEGFKPRHRLAASNELLKRGFHTAPGHSEEDYQDEGNKECDNQSCYHWKYAVKRWHIDSANRKALEQLYGSEEAASVGISAVLRHREAVVNDHSHVPDHDFTPIENPGDDPYGKGSYGYETLCASFGDNQAIRKANIAVEEYKKQLAEFLENEKTSNEDPLAGHPHDTPVGEGFKPSSDPEETPTPEPPPRKKPRKIHLGPPGEDHPPDDDSRRYRDPGEIRVPLKDLVSISPVPI